MSASSYIVGLDLGQASDYSALCVVERTAAPDPANAARRLNSFAVRHLHRWKLGTPYPVIVEDVAALGRRPPLPLSMLAMDGTGVGRAVVDLFRGAKLPLQLVPISITGGDRGGSANGFLTVPKRNLVAVMQTLAQGRRFHIAPGLSDAKVLGKKLQAFRVKVSLTTGNETFEAWRERDHDDLVLAVALACWLGSRPPTGGYSAGGERKPTEPSAEAIRRIGTPGGLFGGW
jgi:hypothetical protein